MHSQALNPLVSVIMPTYRRSDYLVDAIQSVLDQTLERLELIVVEDGDTGESASFAHYFRDERLRYLCQEHAGRSAARNLGMQMARGLYLAFLDDDDLYLPEKLAAQVAFLETHPDVDAVAAGAQIINEQSMVRTLWRPWVDQPDLTLMACLYSCPLAPSTVLFRRQVLDRLDHWFDPEMDLAEDTDLFIRMLHAGCRFAWLPAISSAYRVHRQSSQWDGAAYSLAYRRVLDKLFALPEVPAEATQQKLRLYAHSHLAGACLSYATGQVEAAQRDMTQAILLQPEWAEGTLPRAVAQISGFARTFRVNHPREYIDRVFDNLPTSLNNLLVYRGEAHAAFFIGRVFAAHKSGDRPALRDWLQGMWWAPRRLRNRGLWSILGTIIVGPRAMRFFRYLFRRGVTLSEFQLTGDTLED